MEGKIIAFIGTVGAGKSTQSKLLERYFKERGLRCKAITVGTFSGFSLQLNRFLSYLRRKGFLQLEHDDRWAAFKVKVLLLLDIISTVIYILPLFLLLNKLLKYTLVVEDYFLTNIMDYLHITSNWYCKKYSSDKLFFKNNVITRMAVLSCVRLIKNFPPYIVFLLDADDYEIAKRLRKRPSFEYPEYIRFRRRALKILSTIVGEGVTIYIDTAKNKSIMDTHYKIVKSINLF